MKTDTTTEAKAKHTPGPLTVAEDFHIYEDAPSHRLLAILDPEICEVGMATCRANAKLYASSPDLLSALVKIADDYAALRELYGIERERQTPNQLAARAAIAKATA